MLYYDNKRIFRVNEIEFQELIIKEKSTKRDVRRLRFKQTRKPIYLADYLEGNKFYEGKIKKWNKKAIASLKPTNHETEMEDEFIDNKTEDFMFDFKNETKNKFIVEEGYYYLYVMMNPYMLCFVDFCDFCLFDLYCCFKVIRMEKSPFTYKRGGYECELVLLIGADEVLFLFFNTEDKKYFEVSLHLRNTEFMWQKVLFLDKSAFLVLTENNDLYFTLLNEI